MQHLIFTKFNMPGFPGDPHMDPTWLRGRVDLFKKWLLPSMKQQTCQDFTWIVHCWQESSIYTSMRELVEIAKGYDNLRIMWLQKTPWDLEWLENVRGIVKPGLLLTSRIDSDDAVHKDFVRVIQDGMACLGKPGFYYCSPFGYMHKDGRCYARNYHRNPFLSYLETVYSDRPQDIITVHARQHCHAEPVETLTFDPMWLHNVHGGNQGNRWNPRGKEFDFSEISKDFIGE